MASDMNRRKFLGYAAASAGAVTIVPRHVLGGAGHVAPSEKITLAHIGMGTQGFRELVGLLAEPELQIVAVCDPNKDSSDYVEWGKDEIRRPIAAGSRQIPTGERGAAAVPGGRDVGQEVVDAVLRRRGCGRRIQGLRRLRRFPRAVGE